MNWYKYLFIDLLDFTVYYTHVKYKIFIMGYPGPRDIEIFFALSRLKFKSGPAYIGTNTQCIIYTYL